MDAVTGLMDALKAGGPYAMAAIFILGWWLERKDRQEKETHLRAVYEKTVTLAVETKVTVEKMQGAVTALTDAIRSV
ncbi:MAG TPA: hypothetical protein VET26_12250, partial [Candidatus Sulfotelmatobacter sp.]|nr:hypothetical protein [Candidatus Sulfotelmatobacter sp.]